MTTPIRTSLLGVLLTIVCVGCKSHGVRETLDNKTLVSVITSDPEMVLFRNSYAGDFGRDFVSIGPIELIGSTRRGYYLWLSFWATLPNGNYRQLPQPEKIVIVADDQRFELARMTTDFRDLEVSKPVYESPIRGAAAGYFDVSTDLLVAMSAQTAFTIEVGDDEFVIWGEQDEALASFSQFVIEATGY